MTPSPTSEDPTAAPSREDGHLSRSTFAVLANTAATGVLGMGFWLLAAVLYEPATVAASVAASSLLIALSFAAQLNLGTALSRFLPEAGEGQRATLRQTYRLAIGAAVILAAAVVLVGILRGGELIKGGDFSLTVVTAVCLVGWVVFALQDSALVAVRRASWLPFENGLTTIAKLALLPALLFLPGSSAVLLAWTLPAIPAIWVVNRALFGRLLVPGHAPPVPARQMLRYSGVDLFGTAAMILALRVIPIVVVEITDSDIAAFVNVPWSILTVAAIALADLSRMMLSEMSHAPSRAMEVADRTTRLVLWIFVPGAIIGAALTYPVLSLVGEGYATSGTPVIAFGLLGLIPASVVECRLARFRFVGEMSSVAQRQVVRAGLIFSSVLVALVSGRPELIGAAFTVANVVSLGFIRRIS